MTGVVDPGSSPEYQNLEQFVEEVEAHAKVLDEQIQIAGDLDALVEQVLAKAPNAMADIEIALKDAQTHFVQEMEAAEHAMEETAQHAHTVAETDLPAVEKHLEEVPAALDALVDPVRAELVTAFETLDHQGFDVLATAVQAVAKMMEDADDGGSPLQPFLELPGEIHSLAEGHHTAQEQAATQIDAHTGVLTTAGEHCHETAEAGAQTWGHDCVDAIRQHCDTHSQTVVTIYEGWQQALDPEKAAVQEAITEAHTNLTNALDSEEAKVEHEAGEAQHALDTLEAEMSKAAKELDAGDNTADSLLERFLPELKVARSVAGKVKDIMDAVGQ